MTVARQIITHVCILFTLSLNAQFECISGDCNSGYGKGILKIAGFEAGKYEGNFNLGKFSIGKMNYAKGGYYEGEWENNIVNGIGVMFYPDNSYKAGNWENGKLIEEIAISKVKLILDSKLSSQNFSCLSGDCYDGYGESINSKGDLYTGNFKDGLFEGRGKIKYTNNDLYDGNWKNGKIHGKGTYYFENGKKQSGEWSNGTFINNPTTVYALVVGVSDYRHFQKLNFTTSDAKKFYTHWCSPSGGLVSKENIKLLLDNEASSENILNSMSDLYEKADTNDLIIFYFAGHGLEGMFLPVDYENGSKIVSHGSIINIMRDSDAKYKLILADACHSGSLRVKYEEYVNNGYQFPLTATRGGKTVKEQALEFYKSFINVKGGLSIIMSSAPDEISLEANKLQQGVFSYFVVEGLKGKADEDDNKTITAKELFEYVSKNVDRYTHGFQTPIFGGSGDQIPVGVIFDED